MPFPWKKAKVTRITRMVADLQSPKRGGSLVVETGFPTSLIDLFVKNRDKLRRPSIKRKKKKKNKPITVAADTPAHDPPPIAADDDDDDNLPVDSEISSLPAAEPEKLLATAAVAMTRATKAAEIGSPEAVFLAAIRVFAVAALALSTKKLVIGVTLSAFVLLFLEFVGKRLVLRLMRPFGSKDKDEDEDEDEEFVAVRELVVVDETGSQSSAEGIEASAAGNSRDEEAFGPDLELLSRDRKWGFLDSNCQEQVLVVDNSKISSTSSSKRAKIRKKIISNFVPKKLRSSKKSKKLNVLVEVLEEQEEEEAQEGHESGAIGAKENCEEIEEDGAEEAIGSSAVSEEDGGGRGGVGGRGENWAAVAMLLVVVLLGLFGGRIFALLLTIVWCFAMKLIGIGTQKRSSS